MSVKKGNQKHKARCKAYKDEGRRTTNKIKRIQRHLANQPNDKQSKESLKKITNA